MVLFAPDPGGGAGRLPDVNDKVVHAVLFGLLAAAVLWWWPRAGRRPSRTAAGVLAGLAVYAVGSEVVQDVLLAERSGDPLDVLADLVGAGLVVGSWWVRRR